MGFLLWLLSKALSFLLSIPNYAHIAIGSIRYKGKLKYIDTAFLRAALAQDIYANVAFATMLNDLFIKKGGYHYGKLNETISSATGKNWVKGKLAFMGMCLAGGLNFIDWKNRKKGGHCWISIQGDRLEYDLIGRPGDIPWYYTACFFIISLSMFYALGKLAIWLIVLLHTLLFS